MFEGGPGFSPGDRRPAWDNQCVTDKSIKSTNDIPSSRTSGSGIRASDATTEGIRVQVTSMFVPEESSPREGQFFFAYRIIIANIGTETAQLLSRHWIITDAEGKVTEVRGDGVVGAQPVLAPGERFEYTSYCPLKTNVGTMHGTYTMVRPDGETFEARIAPFTLAVPNALN
jgi:ApaG protein